MKLTFSLIVIVAAIFVASRQLPVFYTANPDYVKRMASVAALREFKDGDLVSNEATRVPSARDRVAVTIRLKESKKTAVDGLLAREEIDYALRLTTSSQCIELEPGCVQVKEKQILKTVSVKSPI